MAKVRSSESQPSSRPRRPALSIESRENQLVAYAYDLVEQRLLDGTASSQETTHFLKLGSIKAELEKEKLRKENALLDAKTNAIRSAESSEELYKNAIKAFASYSGRGDVDVEDY